MSTLPDSALPAASPGVAAAREHDAAGRHGEALQILKSAAAAGDRDAMTELGHRLLMGDRAPRMSEQAMALIAGAARLGDGRALARMAALTGAGAFVPQDWTAALVLLGSAAAAGDAGARGQLCCLRPGEPEPADWRAFAAGVDLVPWLTPAPRTALHPKVFTASALATRPVCDWLISRARHRLEPAKVYDAVSRQEMVHAMRTNTLANFDLSTLDLVQFLVQARMALTCGQRLQQLEAPMVLHYSPGQQITPHYDFIDAQAADYAEQIRQQGQRSITFLLYLNDAYTGGETTFPKLGIVHRGTGGAGLFFINSLPDRSPDREMLHTGSPPTSGEKWLVTQFIRDIRLRP